MQNRWKTWFNFSKSHYRIFQTTPPSISAEIASPGWHNLCVRQCPSVYYGRQSLATIPQFAIISTFPIIEPRLRSPMAEGKEVRDRKTEPVKNKYVCGEMIGRTSAKEQPCFVSRQEKKHWCVVNEKGMDGNMETWWKERSTEKRFKVESIRDKCRIWLSQIGLSISVIISQPRLPLPLFLFPCSRSITATKIVLDDSMRWQLDYGNTPNSEKKSTSRL